MTASDRHRLLVLSLVAVAVIALAEAFFVVNAGRLGPGRIQTASPLDDKRELAWRLHRQGVAVDTVILGNSTAHCGVDPDTIADISANHISSFNGALPGYDYEVLRPFYRYVYAPLFKPAQVVLAVSMMDVNRNGKPFRRRVSSLTASPWWPLYLGDNPADLQGLLFRHAAIYRYGLTLRRMARETRGLRLLVFHVAWCGISAPQILGLP